MAGYAGERQLSLIPFLSLARDVAEDAATEPDPDACLRRLRSGLIRLGFARAGVWITDSDDPTLARGTWGTDWDGSEIDEHGVTRPISDFLGSRQLEAGDRIVVS